MSGRSFRDWMAGAAIVVVGSVVPWYEVLTLESGAALTEEECERAEKGRGRGRGRGGGNDA